MVIYVVEDDESIRELVVYALRSTGFEACGFSDGKSFFDETDKILPSLVILDIMLPGEDGTQILKRLKSNPRTRQLPVILLTAKSTEFDKVIGLDSGADDYITKPFGVMELVSRVKAVLRRVNENICGRPENADMIIGSLRLNADSHIVRVGDGEISLTLKEFELLKYLMENEGIVLSRDKLLESVWGYDYEGETRTVDVHIRTLRQKLGDCGSLIETVRGVGYRIGGSP